MIATEYDVAWCYAQAHRATWRLVRRVPFLAPLREDLTQETVFAAVLAARRGMRITRQFLSRLMYEALGKTLGDRRYAGRRAAFDAEVALGEGDADAGQVACAPPHELRAIALWRLQRAWPHLSETQKVALTCLITDGSWIDLERETGISSAHIQRAKLDALAKIDGRKALGKGNGAERFGGSVRSRRAA